MLSDQEIDWLSCEVAATAEAMGQEISPNAVALLVADFSTFPRAQLKEALRRVRMEGVGRLTAKALLDQLDALNGRIGADEAFALVLKAADEAQTVVWTDEIAQAWTVCAPMLKGRDQVGARMAFRQAYDRIVQDARAAMKRPAPVVSIGSDPQLRVVAVTQAHEQRRLPLALALAALEGLAEFDAQENCFVALGSARPLTLALPAGAAVDGVLVQAAQHQGAAGLVAPNVAQAMRDAMASSRGKAARRRLAIQRLERMRFAQKQRAAAQATQQYLDQQNQQEGATHE